ncbi:MAG: hypothetical protein ACR2PM_13615 [Hyphomicrobiales bacterium]
MEQASAHIANWGGYRLFQQALGDVGWERFPVLHAELPDVNGGFMSAEQAGRVLAELDAFLDCGVIGEKTVLLDTSTEEELYQRIAAYDGVFILSGSTGVDVGLEASGVFVRDRGTGEELFRAQRLRQFKPDASPVTGDDNGIVWENLDTGQCYAARLAIPGKVVPWDNGEWQNAEGKVRREYPSELHVEVAPWRAEEFRAIVDALKTVSAASVETGNPVIWC